MKFLFSGVYMLKTMSVSGYRGFRSTESIDLSLPNGSRGSGLTVITGPNNSGKSSLIECMRARSGHQNVSFTAGTRNSVPDFVSISYEIDGEIETIKSATKGSSETVRENAQSAYNIFVLPSRRAFNPYFGKSVYDRQQYLINTSLPAQRSSTLSGFEYRLFNILKDPARFNDVLYRILADKPEWTIDQSDQGQYFLKFLNGGHSHSSDGMGEGIISIFSIVDAIYDSSPKNTIVIDEPELSLHPALQKKIIQLLLDYSADRQIIISTHSPYFIDLNSISRGSNLVRVVTGNEGTKIYQLSDEAKGIIARLSGGNIFNPHVFGLDSRELFFQEDKIILTEGQEDVLLLPEVATQAEAELNGSFFGWGVGGASNIQHLCKILKDLGFKKVFGLLDGDKKSEMELLCSNYPSYSFSCIPANDIRTKKERPATSRVDGLLDEKLKLKPELLEETRSVLQLISGYMSS